MNIFSFIILTTDLLLRPIFAEVKLDDQHLELYPYCGKLFGHAKHDGTSRVVNSKDSEIQYPWVVLVMQEHMGVFEKKWDYRRKNDNYHL